MSAMGELNFFLGLQVLQKKDGIFLSQYKYVRDILNKFGYSDVRSSNTPMDKENPWGKDGTGKDVDLHLYRSMIGSLMYLTTSRPDIMFAVCAYARHQVTPKECHLHVLSCWACHVRICQRKSHHLYHFYRFHTAKTFGLVWIWLGGDYGNVFIMGFNGIQCNMARLAFCDYNNMIAILEKYKHNQDFHQIADFIEASHIRYALTFNSTVYVSHIRQFWSTARIETTEEETKILATVDDEHASPIKDDSQGEACLTNSGLEADQDRANIPKTSTLPSDSTPRVTFLAADEGSIAQSRDDAPIKGRRLDEREEAAERVNDDTEDMATVLTSMDAASILTSGGVQVVPTAAKVATATVSIPTGSGVVSTASPTIPTAALIFTTATESTPYTRRKGKEKMVESDTPKKKKLQEQIDVQVARELEEEMARDA
uniref:Putative polyprotein n=1 Tax=Tanacetum cinerariifolium TaxID=118510 RepID=A0A699HM51_TANCI|nr:putative polyprotein [Tanacetum cinerariifolium]